MADGLYRLAIDTRDSEVRYEIFALLVRAANARFQGQLFDLAVNPWSADRSAGGRPGAH